MPPGQPGHPDSWRAELFAGGCRHCAKRPLRRGRHPVLPADTPLSYGEIEPFQRAALWRPVPPTRYRPDIPQWLENVILKAVARDPGLRFETAEEMLAGAEIGERKPLHLPSRTPLQSVIHVAVAGNCAAFICSTCCWSIC